MKKLLLILGLVASAGSWAQVNTQYGQQAAASELYNANISIFGYQALYACQYCYGTTAIGYEALRVSSGNYNTAVGIQSMYNSTSGYANVGVGAFSLENLGTGSQNVAVGYEAGSCATVNGNYNVWVNNCGLAKDDRVIRIGTQGVQKFAQIAGIYNVKLPAGGGQALYVNSKGQIGVISTAIVKAAPAAAASVDEAVSLRADIAALRNEVHALKAQLHLR